MIVIDKDGYLCLIDKAEGPGEDGFFDTPRGTHYVTKRYKVNAKGLFEEVK